MIMLDAKGAIVTPPLARQICAQIALKFGYIDGLDIWAEMHPSQYAEWENCAVMVQRIDVKEPDANWMPRRTFASFPVEFNAQLSPSVILLRKNHEVIAEIARLGLTEWKDLQ
jgi:hypothetical protein